MSNGGRPLISLVIPAWNEAEYLPRLLDSIELARDRFRGGPKSIEVIVADNDSTDATRAIAESRGCRTVSVTKRCIAAARNAGARASTGSIVAFVDADFRINVESFNFIDAVMHIPGCLGGATGLTMERWSVGISASWYLILPPLWMMGLDGGIWFCRRDDFEAVGGFNENVRAGEDVRFLMALKRLGKTRKPRERLVTRFTAKSLGIPRAIALNSTRKFDRHGDWHMFVDAVRHLPMMLWQGRRRLDEYVDEYWYRGR